MTAKVTRGAYLSESSPRYLCDGVVRCLTDGAPRQGAAPSSRQRKGSGPEGGQVAALLARTSVLKHRRSPGTTVPPKDRSVALQGWQAIKVADRLGQRVTRFLQTKNRKSDTLNVRRAGDDDRETLYALWDEWVERESPVPSWVEGAVEGTRAQIDVAISSGCAVIAEERGDVLGFRPARHRDRAAPGDLTELYVRPKARRRGSRGRSPGQSSSRCASAGWFQ